MCSATPRSPSSRADGVHFRIRLEEDGLCALVMIGVRLDGTKELIAIEDGYRESTESWAGLLRALKRRGDARVVESFSLCLVRNPWSRPVSL